jgi:glycosyltransferase involved in cell wall biosynthesis
MHLTITSDYRFSLAPDGSVWTKVTYDYPFWQRYLAAFASVRIVARAKLDPAIDASYKRVTGPQVEFWNVPFYLGPGEFFWRRKQVRASLHAAVGPHDALICRVGSLLADELLPTWWKQERPYGLEVVGDPHEAMGPGAIRHPLRPLFRAWATRSLKRQCSHAVAVAYVTRETLQRHYPCPAHSVGISDVANLDFMARPKVFTTNYSSISWKDTDFVSEARHFDQRERPRILFVGSFAQMYKGPDTLMHAVRQLLPEIEPTVIMVGDGKHRAEIEALAQQLGVAQYVQFLGELPAGQAIRDQLDQATLFVMPSRTEGLPRAMIEAMTRALPCIGSRVGGIPELLHEDDIVEPNNPRQLADKIREVVADPERLSEMSRRNLERAYDYRPDELDKRRTEFYRFLRHSTQRWLETRKVLPWAKGATA